MTLIEQAKEFVWAHFDSETLTLPDKFALFAAKIRAEDRKRIADELEAGLNSAATPSQAFAFVYNYIEKLRKEDGDTSA